MIMIFSFKDKTSNQVGAVRVKYDYDLLFQGYDKHRK